MKTLTLLIGCLLVASCDERHCDCRNRFKGTVVKVLPGDPESSFYVLKGTHTLVTEGNRRVLLMGDLGNPGDEIEVRNLTNSTALYH